MKFVTKSDLSLKAGKYLISGENETPVFNYEFVKIQEEAHYLVNLASKVKDADFTVKTVKSFEQIVNEVKTELNNNKKVYVSGSEEVEMPLTNKLKDEALSWLKSQATNNKSEKLNSILQKYNLLSEFEEFGLYFSEDKIVTLNKIYTMDDIIKAITVLEPHLSV